MQALSGTGRHKRWRRAVVKRTLCLAGAAWHSDAVDDDGDPELVAVRGTLDRLGKARVLPVAKAADLLGLSASAVRAWCSDEADPLPHDHRPGRRPSRLVSEAELVRYVLDRPSVRDRALTTLRERALEAPAAALPPAGEPAVRSGAENRTRRRRTAGAAPAWPERTAGTGMASPAAAPASAGEHETAWLRGEVVRLQEQVAHLAALVEELEASGARKSALWLAALRSSSVPGTAQSLDGLQPADPPPPA